MSVAAKKKTASQNVPDKIGKYAIINQVGRGSTGMVYLSHDPYYGRDVAIKVYNTALDKGPVTSGIGSAIASSDAAISSVCE